jgi:hypothetical protein
MHYRAKTIDSELDIQALGNWDGCDLPIAVKSKALRSLVNGPSRKVKAERNQGMETAAR